ncbi:MAG: NAD(P)H-dependent oxidoreductase [Sphingobacteriia bacterium]|nr:NAD(P)H-dependent oxidoreductase [Sphingobacteriia bacterium]
MQKKILVINAHPYDESYVSELFRTYVNHLDTNKHQVKTIELGKMTFDPVLRYGYTRRMPVDNDIELSQNLVSWADHIVFFYPIWWTTMPALLKGWIDRVITPGFAFNSKGFKTTKHLKGRTAQLFMTSDAPALYQRLILNSPVRLMKRHILGYCGIKVVKSDIFGMVTSAKRERARKRFIEKVKESAINFK